MFQFMKISILLQPLGSSKKLVHQFIVSIQQNQRSLNNIRIFDTKNNN